MALNRSLQDIGFTEYEAKVYLALLGNPGITRYEVGRRSGVPRAKVYEVLEGLVRRGAALQETSEGRQLYHALGHSVLLYNHSRAVSRLLANLGAELDAVTARRHEPRLLMLRDQDSTLDHFRHICRTVRGHLLVTGWPEDRVGRRPTGEPDNLQHWTEAGGGPRPRRSTGRRVRVPAHRAWRWHLPRGLARRSG